MDTAAVDMSQSLEHMFHPETLQMLSELLVYPEITNIVDQEIVNAHGKLLIIDLRPYAKSDKKAEVSLSDNVAEFVLDRQKYLTTRFGHLTMSDRLKILAGLVVPKDVSYWVHNHQSVTVANYLRRSHERAL